jgi:hypothetical protein
VQASRITGGGKKEPASNNIGVYIKATTNSGRQIKELLD